MAKVKPTAMRARISETLGGLEIVLPSKKPWLYLLFISSWLVGWSCGWAAAASAISRGEGGLFVLAWFGGWSTAGLYIGYWVLWMLFGYETIGLTAKELVHKKTIGFWTRSSEFDLTEVQNLRLATRTYNPYLQQRDDGALAFDYGATTHKFGYAIDEAEASQILAALNRYRGG